MQRFKNGGRSSRAARIFGTLALVGLLRGGQPNEGSRDQPVLVPQEIVAAHNVVRSKLGVSPLVWSDNVAKVAQVWANTLLAKGTFEHRTDHKYGENLLEATGIEPTPSQVVSEWADEAKNYQYSANSCSEVCGHYTQLVWRDTKEVGCAVVQDSTRQIWVCNYAPYGNVVGERPY